MNFKEVWINMSIEQIKEVIEKKEKKVVTKQNKIKKEQEYEDITFDNF